MRLFVATVVIAAISLLSLARESAAGIIWNSGTMDAFARASTYGSTVTDDPPLKAMLSGSDNYGASATATSVGEPFTYVVSASVKISTFFGIDSVSFNGRAQVSSTTPYVNQSNAQASSVFLVDSTKSYLITSLEVPAGPPGGQASVVMKNSSNQIVYQDAFFGFAGGPSAPQSIVLTPDTYSISWSIQGFPVGGGGTTLDWRWTLTPEPASLALVMLPMLLSRRCRPISI